MVTPTPFFIDAATVAGDVWAGIAVISFFVIVLLILSRLVGSLRNI